MTSLNRVLALTAFLAPAFAQKTPNPTVTLSVHLVMPCSGAATVKVKTARGTQCLDPQPFLTQQDVESAELQKNSKGNPIIFLTFHNEAAMRELQITRKNIGNPVAIVLNGQVVSAPVVAAASRFLYLAADFKQAQAASLAAALNRQAGNR
jgi:preprotein translocase subunit SecD